MDYNSILDKIEQDRKNESAIDLYRYNGLMEAIDFFSNRLTFNQIIESAYEFVNEMLVVSKSALFVLNDNEYTLVNSKGIDTRLKKIPITDRLKTFATLYGTIQYDIKHLEDYFPEDILAHYQVKIMIPLIMDTTLAGFLFLSDKATDTFNSNDYIISETLMRLFSNALENYKRLEKLQMTNIELDEKVFNLFAINHSSKALLSEHSLEVLYNLSIDVFSELTLSGRTSFFLFDEEVCKYVLKAYKNVYSEDVKVNLINLSRKKGVLTDQRFIINVNDNKDRDYFNSLFCEDISILSPLKPLYIILLIKDKEILGFVTLSNTVSGTSYKNSMFELVESLASYTYIALSNAILFKKVENQKKLLLEKLNRLISLNTLMKNVNTSENIETLQELIIKTLSVSFGVEKGIVALYNKECSTLKIVSSCGVNTKIDTININDNWDKLIKGGIILETDAKKVSKYLGGDLSKSVKNKSGLIAIPICLEKYETELLGAIIILKQYEGLISDEENVIVLETIANLVAPLIYNFQTIEKERKALSVNYKEMFIREFNRQLKLCNELDAGLEILKISLSSTSPFNEPEEVVNSLKDKLELVYPIAYNQILIISVKDYALCRNVVSGIALSIGANFDIYKLGKEFNNTEDFYKLFYEVK